MEAKHVEFFKNQFEGILAGTTPISLQEWKECSTGDEADLSQGEEGTSLSMRLKSREQVYFKKIHESMLRLKSGSFGKCEDCGEEISFARLCARPTASLCIHCKEEEESQERSMWMSNRYSMRINRPRDPSIRAS